MPLGAGWKRGVIGCDVSGGQVGMQFKIGGECGQGWKLAAILKGNPVRLGVDDNW